MGIRHAGTAIVASVLLLALVGCTSDEPQPGSTDVPNSSTASGEPSAEALPDPLFVDSAPAGSRLLKMMESSFDPAQASVAVGDIVMFSSGDDLIHALAVNEMPDVTVAAGIPAFYQFEDPGTYSVIDRTTGATATIKVIGDAE